MVVSYEKEDVIVLTGDEAISPEIIPREINAEIFRVIQIMTNY